jgi:CHAT domain-containing protein
LAETAGTLGETQQSLQNWSRAADTYGKVFGADDWRASEARYRYNDLQLISKLSREQLARVIAAREAPGKLRLDKSFQGVKRDKQVAQALALGEQVRRTLLDILGENNIYYANCLAGQASLYDQLDNPDEAEALDRKAAEITGRVMGLKHPIYLQRLAGIVTRYSDDAKSAQAKHDFAAAERLLKRRLETLELRFPAGHWRLRDAELQIDHNAGLARLSDDEFAQIKKLESDIVNFNLFGGRSVPPPNSSQKPLTPDEMAQQLREAYDLHCQLIGASDSQSLDCLGALIEACQKIGNSEEAIARKRKYLDGCRETFGKDHPRTARIASDLGVVYYNRGDYAQAEPLLSEAREVLENIGKTETEEYGTILNNLAVLYEALGDFDRAEPLLRKVVSLTIPTNEEVPIEEGDYYDAGDKYEVLMAEFNMTEALRIDTVSAPGPKRLDFSKLAQSVNNLGLIAQSRHDLGSAESLLRQSLGLIRNTDKEGKSNDFATGLANLAAIHQMQGDLDRADLLLERVVAIRSDSYNKEDLAQALTSQGAIAYRRGEFDRASRLWEQALAERKAYSGDRHPNTAISIANLAVLDDRQGNTARAAERLESALDMTAENLQLVSAIQSERQQLITSKTLRGYLDQLLSLTTRAEIPPPDVYRHVLGWKGMVSARQRRMRAARQAARTEDGDALRKMYDELDAVSQDLARMAVGELASKVRREKLAELALRKDTLEQQLSKASSRFAAWKRTSQLTIDELISFLPPDGALVDVVEYAHTAYPDQHDEEPIQSQRLTAFILRPGRPTVQVDLGAAQPIDTLVDECRALWTGGRTDGSADPAAELRRRIWDPLSPHLEGIQTVLVSPDGALGRFPLAALPGKKPDSYLIEDVAIAVLPVPQLLGELVANSSPIKGEAGGMLLVGDVDFDARPGAGDDDIAAAAPGEGSRQKFATLPGTAEEVKTVKRLYDATHSSAPAVALEGGAATESAVRKQSPAARYLHLATHGFFAPADVKRADTDDREVLDTDSNPETSVEGWNPGLLSGIVLAGVNQPVDGLSDDGVLTAAEVAALDLSAAQLVVLSACETGLGQMAGGEGALGLQRALQTAGARSVVSSLWKVDDAATVLLMSEFYKNLWQNRQPPLKAFRAAQLSLLNGKVDPSALRGLDLIDDAPRPETSGGRLSPRLWAAFVISGSPE